MATPERTALVVSTRSAAAPRDTGATLRLGEVVTLLERTGHRVQLAAERLPTHRVDLAVAVSYACAGAVRQLQRQAKRTWLDAVDSWVLVNASGLRCGHPSYLARAARDGVRLARMPAPDLLTYISGADMREDRGTVRGRARLVLPGTAGAAPPLLPRADARRVVLTGDWDYAPNADGLRWFVDHVLPALRRLTDVGVEVYGAGDTAVAAAGCTVRGYAISATELYRECDVHVAPVRFGGGVKRKVLQPLLAGLPVVTTRAGAHGLRSSPLLDVHDDPRAFAAAVAFRIGRESPVDPGPFADRNDTAAVTAWLRA